MLKVSAVKAMSFYLVCIRYKPDHSCQEFIWRSSHSYRSIAERYTARMGARLMLHQNLYRTALEVMRES